jgi:hypothetical protein
VTAVAVTDWLRGGVQPGKIGGFTAMNKPNALQIIDE